MTLLWRSRITYRDWATCAKLLGRGYRYGGRERRGHGRFPPMNRRRCAACSVGVREKQNLDRRCRHEHMPCFQLLSEHDATAAQPCRSRAGPAIQHRRDFIDRVSLHVVEDQDRAIVIWQEVQCPVDFDDNVVGRLVKHGRLGDDRGRLPLVPSARRHGPAVPHRQLPTRTVQPRRKARVFNQISGLLRQCGKHRLGDVVGFMCVAHDPTTHTPDHALMPGNQDSDGLLVS
jgi:hypothetical protein